MQRRKKMRCCIMILSYDRRVVFVVFVLFVVFVFFLDLKQKVYK